MSQSKAHVALLDAQPLALAGLTQLCRASGYLHVVYAGREIEVVRALKPRPQLVVMDINLGDRPLSIRAARELVSRGSAIVAIGAHPRDPVTRRAQVAGALGYVSRHDEPDQFLNAMRSALNGQRWVSPLLSRLIGESDGAPNLSEQEILALQLYAGGMKMDAVARRMQVAPSTVKEYIDRVRAKYASDGRPAPTKVDLYHVAKQDGFITS